MIVTEQPVPKVAPQVGPRKATLAIHGGAGGTLPPVIPPHLEQAYRAALRRSLNKGYSILSNGGTALEAVCRSVQEMEDDPLFNAARGAVFTSAGTNECEASVMNAYAPNSKLDSQANLQRKRRCASAVLIRNTRNPILLAKALYENARENPHVMLSGKTAEELGWQFGCEKVDDQYYYTRRRWLEHRRSLNLPDDEDPAMCQTQGEFVENDVGLNPFEPPPAYYTTNTSTDGTPSLYASSQDERDTSDDGRNEKSAAISTTTDEAITPSCRSTVGEDDGDMGMQYFIDWDLNFDARRRLDANYQESINDGSESVQHGSWRSNSFEEIPRSENHSNASLHRRQPPLSLDSLPAGTVGAVALDEYGNLAVATSTGGVTNKLPGRIGDTPTPGAGFWAEYWKTDAAGRRFKLDSKREERTTSASSTLVEEKISQSVEKAQNRSCGATCDWVRRLFGSSAHLKQQQDEEDAIEQAKNTVKEESESPPPANVFSKEYRGVALSGTGTGDYFLRCSFASLVVHRMRFLGEGVDVASSKAVAEMGELGGVGGAICIDDSGRVSFPMNSATMNRGYITQGCPPRVAIYAHEECL